MAKDTRRGKKVLIFAYGQYIIREVLKLNKILNKKIIPKIINMSCLNNFNKEWLKSVTRDCKPYLLLMITA